MTMSDKLDVCYYLNETIDFASMFVNITAQGKSYSFVISMIPGHEESFILYGKLDS
jgi:hypothetical protein